MPSIQGLMNTARNIGSDLSGTVNDTLSGVTGRVTKAALLFPDMKPSGVTKSVGKEASVRKEFTNAMVKKLANALSYGSAVCEDIAKPVYEKCVTLQFNPSSIQISAVGGGRYAVADYGVQEEGKGGGRESGNMSFTEISPFVQVSFRVLFDQTHNADAFMADKLTVNYEQTAQNVLTLVAGQEYSVRPQMEGFLGAVQSGYHRMAVFQWGSMRYCGMMNQVQGNYTMFNVSGNPVRGEVNINLIVLYEEEGAKLDYWERRYTAILDRLRTDKDGLSAVDTGHTRERLGNIIQL